MTTLKSLFTFIFILTCFTAFSQSAAQPVFLKWKLKPGEVLTYKTEMKIVKDTTSGMGNYFNNFFKNVGFPKTDSANQMPNMDVTMNQMRKQMDVSPSYISTMAWKGNAINVEMMIKGGDSSKFNSGSLASLFDASAIKRDTSDTKPDTLMNSLFRSAMFIMQRVMLRGAINEDGSLNSFYVNNEQRNLLGLFFGLPGKPVKVGDSWSPDVHLVTADQTFTCDSASRENKVTVTDIKIEDGQHVVTIKYDLKERIVGVSHIPFGGDSAKTSQSASYQGTARFSLEKGRWIFYDCLLSENIGGIVTSQKETKYTLSE